MKKNIRFFCILLLIFTVMFFVSKSPVQAEFCDVNNPDVTCPKGP